MLIYANPTRFMNLAARLHRPLWLAALIALAIGLYFSFTAPPDYQQGAMVRIMFIHVPAAWMALFGYSAMALASIMGLVFAHPVAHFAARAVAPIGAGFTLILFFLYLGYIAICRAIDEPLKAARPAAILAIIGFINVPIVKFSVEWWHSLHQPASISRLDAPAIHPELLVPLLIMALAFLMLFLALWLTRLQSEIWQQKLRARKLGLVDRLA